MEILDGLGSNLLENVAQYSAVLETIVRVSIEGELA